MEFIYLLAFVGILLATLVDGKGRRAISRDEIDPVTDLLSEVKGGVLAVNGLLTSCELAVLDCRASFTAASCLNYTKHTSLESGTTYDVYLDDGLDGIPVHYSVVNITVHPEYNPDNYVNNFAILQYNPTGNITWQNAISPKADTDWDNIGFIRVVPDNLVENKWAGFNSEYGSSDHDDTCDKMSEMYAINSGDMACTNLTTIALSADFNMCKVPYGAAYGIANDKAYIIGPYSYSAFNGGDSFCAYTVQRSYYTALANYMVFIAQALNRSLTLDNDYFEVNLTKFSADYDMVDKEYVDDNGLESTKFGGDYYTSQRAGIGLDLNLDFSNAPGSVSEVSAIDASADGKEPAGNKHGAGGGLSSRDTVIVAVCVTVGSAIMVVAVLLYVFCYRKRRRASMYPVDQAEYKDMLEQTIGGASANEGHRRNNDDARSDAMLAPPSELPDFSQHTPEIVPATNHYLVYHTELPPEYDEGIDPLLAYPAVAAKDTGTTRDTTTPQE